MAEKHRSSVTRKPLFCLFTVTSMLFFLSWFFVLRSSGRLRLLRNKQLIPVVSHGDHASSSESNARASNGNEAIVLDDKVEASNAELVTSAGNQVQEQRGGEGEASEEQKQKNQSKGSNVTSNRNGKVPPLKVYMYDLDPEFHFELLDWKRQGDSFWPDIRTTIPHYPGALNLQHSVEYWLTLDLLASEFHDYPSSLTAERVSNSSEADVIFVPFFSSLSANRYNKVNLQEKKSRNSILQEKLVKFLTSQKEWKSSGGLDHLIMAHHPNSMLNARMKLWPAMFILSDFGRYPPNIANIDKDVIAPYTHIVKTYVDDTSDFDTRPTLVYFRGAISRKDGGSVRQELYYLLKDEKDVHFSFGSVQKDGIRQATHGMRSSKFCLNIAGDTPSSNRLFDAIASHCVPVIISNDIELPYEDVLDYSEFCIFVRTSDALKPKFLINLINSIKKDEWTRMWKKLKEVERFYEFQFPSKEGDAVQMIWQAVARKVPSVRMKIHRSSRYSQTAARPERGSMSIPVPASK